MNINSNNHSFFNLKSNWIIFLISLTIIFSKWSVSYFFFPLESFDLKIFLDSQSVMYFPYLINTNLMEFVANNPKNIYLIKFMIYQNLNL